ncbi:MAG: response regulator [Verrucomicrobiota bacterium]|jgi:chemosensory pili system protein ChpA (sensor histidine kinase/response regulator)
MNVPAATNMNAIKAKTILYVEDDPVVLTAYRHRLEGEGYSVESAKDGLEAMKVLLRLVPDLVVLDLMLPKFDGGEVLKFMQANPRLKTIPVIILSTNSIVDADEEYVLEGANQRFIKDQCTFPMVLQAIQKLLAEAPAKDHALPDGQVDNGLPKKPEKTAA